MSLGGLRCALGRTAGLLAGGAPGTNGFEAWRRDLTDVDWSSQFLAVFASTDLTHGQRDDRGQQTDDDSRQYRWHDNRRTGVTSTGRPRLDTGCGLVSRLRRQHCITSHPLIRHKTSPTYYEYANITKRTFVLLPPFNPHFKNVSLAPDRWNFACLSFRHIANYSSINFPIRPTRWLGYIR